MEPQGLLSYWQDSITEPDASNHILALALLVLFRYYSIFTGHAKDLPMRRNAVNAKTVDQQCPVQERAYLNKYL